MNLQIGATNLAVNHATPFRYQNGKLVLKVEVLQSEITHDELKTLFKENTEDIIRTDDSGKVTTLAGFRYTVQITDKTKRTDNGDGTYTETDVFECEVECVSEAEYQNGLMKAQLVEHAAVINAQNEIIANTSSEVALLNDTLLEVMMAESEDE